MIKFYTIAVWKHTFVATLSSSPVCVRGPRPAPAIPTVLVHMHAHRLTTGLALTKVVGPPLSGNIQALNQLNTQTKFKLGGALVVAKPAAAPNA